MHRDLLRTLRQLPDPRMLRVLGLSLVLAAVLFAILLVVVGWALTSLTLFQWGWLDTLVDLLGGLATLLVAILIFPGAAIAVQGLFLERIATAVESRYYPGLPEPRSQGWAEQLAMGAKLTATILAVNLVALPVYLGLTFVPPLNLILFYLINGFLLGREYFELVATRRMTPEQALQLRHALKRRVWLMGAAIAFLFSIPLLNLAAPALGTAMMLHLFERLRGRDFAEETATAPGPSSRPASRGPAKALAGLFSLGVLLAAGNLAVTPTASGPVPNSDVALLTPPEPDELIGLRQVPLWRKLGSPQLVRRDGDARVWQYRGEDCILDVYLYEDGADFRAAHVSVRTREDGRLAREWCYAALLEDDASRDVASTAIAPVRPSPAPR